MTEGAVMVIIVMMMHLMQKLDLETLGEMIKEGYLLGTFELCSGMVPEGMVWDERQNGSEQPEFDSSLESAKNSPT